MQVKSIRPSLSYIGVGSFSIFGRPNPARPTSILGWGIAKSTYMHACKCTYMHTHMLNIHTPMHAHAYMHEYLTLSDQSERGKFLVKLLRAKGFYTEG